MIIGQRPRTHQAHLAVQHAPELRQLIEAGAPQQFPDHRQHPRIAAQLEIAPPLRPILRMLPEPFFQQTIAVQIHRPQFPHSDAAAVEALAHLAIERRAAARSLIHTAATAITGRLSRTAAARSADP